MYIMFQLMSITLSKRCHIAITPVHACWKNFLLGNIFCYYTNLIIQEIRDLNFEIRALEF